MPVSRSLVIKHPEDEKCWYRVYQEEYMFGPGLLVAPVESTQKLTKVYLPEGIWYDFLNGEKYDGKQEINTECPLNKLPVFAKGGSIIPMQNIIQNTSEKPSDTLFIHVYYGKEKTSFNYYEDDGLTYEYEKGRFMTRAMTFDPDARQIVLDSSEGDFSSKFRIVKFILHGFNEIVGNWKINGMKTETIMGEINLYNALQPDDPLYNWEPRPEQMVMKIAPVEAGGKIVLSW